MADSLTSSNDAVPEDSSSGSNLSLSVGHYPGEDTFSWENTTFCEDASSNGPSAHSVPPFQGSWQTGPTERLLETQDQMQDGPEQFYNLNFTLAWDVDMSSNRSDSVIGWDLHGDNQWINKSPKEKMQLTLSKLNGLVKKLEQFLENQTDDEDDKSMIPVSSSTCPDRAQASHQEHDSGQDLPTFDPPENENVTHFAQVPPRLQEHEIAEAISQAPGSQRTRTIDTSSNSSDQPEEDTHSSTQGLSCLNFRWVFRWLRQQILSCGGRQPPQKATKSPRQLSQKKRLSQRSTRIQPQESI